MQLPSWLSALTGGNKFANNPANGFVPTFGDHLQGIGHSMMQHYRGEGGNYGGPKLIDGVNVAPGTAGPSAKLSDILPALNPGPGGPVPQINPGVPTGPAPLAPTTGRPMPPVLPQEPMSVDMLRRTMGGLPWGAVGPY